jgi:hypothetical protein
MKIDPEVLFILISIAAVAAIFLAAWWRSRMGSSRSSDPSAWLLEQMVVLAVLIVFGTVVFLLLSSLARP